MCLLLLMLAGPACTRWRGADPGLAALPRTADQGKVPIERLRQYAASWLARVDATQAGLRSVLSSAIQARLAAAHWPPSLAVSGEDGAAAGPGADAGAAFRGFEAAGAEAAAELSQLLTTLTTLQRAAQHERFTALGQASQEGPLLWAAEELAAPLAERLRHHFAGGLPTDRPDRPEWLFATALKAAQQCAPLTQELQPCIGELRSRSCRAAAVAEGLRCGRCSAEALLRVPPSSANPATARPTPPRPQTRTSCRRGTACPWRRRARCRWWG